VTLTKTKGRQKRLRPRWRASPCWWDHHGSPATPGRELRSSVSRQPSAPSPGTPRFIHLAGSGARIGPREPFRAALPAARGVGKPRRDAAGTPGSSRLRSRETTSQKNPFCLSSKPDFSVAFVKSRARNPQQRGEEDVPTASSIAAPVSRIPGRFS